MWRELGLPGLFDVHVHFMPEAMQRKVWAQFDAGGDLIGREWPILYKGSDDERVAWLRQLLAWRQDIEGGEPRQLTHFDREEIFNFAIAPDGKRVVLSRGSSTKDVVLVKDFR